MVWWLVRFVGSFIRGSLGRGERCADFLIGFSLVCE